MAPFTTATGRIIDGLVTMMRARAGYRSPTSTSATGIVVYDTVEVLLQDDALADNYMVIGQHAHNPDDTRSQQMFGQSGQNPGPFGTTRPKDEHGIIQGWCVSQIGDGDLNGTPKAARDAAYAMVADLELVLRADPTVNGTVANLWAFQTQSMGKIYLNHGIVCEVEWIVHYRCRL